MNSTTLTDDREMTAEEAATELATLSDKDDQLAFLVQARNAIAQAQTVPEVKELLGQAEAMKVYFAHKQVSFEIRSIAAEMSERAQRRMGEMLRQSPKNPGAKGVGPIAVTHSDRNQEPTLKELGISKRLSSRAQKLADIPVDKFHETIEALKVEGKDITTTEVLRRCSPRSERIKPELAAEISLSRYQPRGLYKNRIFHLYHCLLKTATAETIKAVDEETMTLGEALRSTVDAALHDNDRERWPT